MAKTANINELVMSRKYESRAKAVASANAMQARRDEKHKGPSPITYIVRKTGDEFVVVKRVPGLVKNGLMEVMFGPGPKKKNDLVFSSPNMNTDNVFEYEVDAKGNVVAKSGKMDISVAKDKYEKAQYNPKYGHVVWAFSDHDLGKKLDSAHASHLIHNGKIRRNGSNFCVISKTGGYDCFRSVDEAIENRSVGSIIMREEDFKKISNLAGKLLYDKACEVTKSVSGVKKNPVKKEHGNMLDFTWKPSKEPGVNSCLFYKDQKLGTVYDWPKDDYDHGVAYTIEGVRGTSIKKYAKTINKAKFAVENNAIVQPDPEIMWNPEKSVKPHSTFKVGTFDTKSAAERAAKRESENNPNRKSSGVIVEYTVYQLKSGKFAVRMSVWHNKGTPNSIKKNPRDISEKVASCFRAGKSCKIDNTETDGTSIFLFGSKIVSKRADGVYVTTGGHATKTTKDRLAPFCEVKVKSGELFLNGKPWDGAWKKLSNVDGDGFTKVK